MKLIYLKSAKKSDSFNVSIGIKILFFRVSVTIEPGRSLLTVRYQELFDYQLGEICSSLGLMLLLYKADETKQLKQKQRGEVCL